MNHREMVYQMKKKRIVVSVAFAVQAVRFTESRALMIYTITGPSGSGKSTLLRRIFLLRPDQFIRIVTSTTRLPRKMENDGEDYDFEPRPKDFETFQAHHFASIDFDGNFYGIPQYAMLDFSRKEKDVIVILDPQGALELRHKYPGKTCNIFIQISKNRARSHLWRRDWKAGKKRLKADVAAGFYDADKIPYDHVICNQGNMGSMVKEFLDYADAKSSQLAS